jgi:hypothetical protein
MPKIREIKSRLDLERISGPTAYLRSMNRVAAPETRNSSASRHGLRISIKGSSAVMRCPLLIWNPQDT